MEDKNSMVKKEELAKIDERIESLEKNIQLHKDLEELHSDERFERVMTEAYFDKEAERIFGLLTTPTTLTRDQIDNLNDKMAAIRNVKSFFKTIIINATMAPDQIEEEKAYRKELNAGSVQIEE